VLAAVAGENGAGLEEISSAAVPIVRRLVERVILLPAGPD